MCSSRKKAFIIFNAMLSKIFVSALNETIASIRKNYNAIFLQEERKNPVIGGRQLT